MPVIARIIGYIFSFFSNEFWGNRLERPHVHVTKGGKKAKFWIDTLELSVNHGFSGRELKEIQHIINDNHELFLQRWHEHFHS